MITQPTDVLEKFPVRKSRRQKQAFRNAAEKYLTDLGYSCTVEKGSFGARNLIAGDPEQARIVVCGHYDTCAWMPIPNLITPCNFFTFLLYQLFTVAVVFGSAFLLGAGAAWLHGKMEMTPFFSYIFVWVLLFTMMFGPANRHCANDNTSGVVTVLEIARTLPANLRDRVCFVLFDLEEAGLIGSASYRSKHRKASEKQMVLNLDCVGDGDEIVFFPSGKIRKNAADTAWLSAACGSFGSKSVALRKKGFAYYPSDSANFPKGVGICALNRSKWAGLYMDKIHTSKDTVLETTNVNLLRAAIITLIAQD